jgi:hypothetical protein
MLRAVSALILCAIANPLFAQIAEKVQVAHAVARYLNEDFQNKRIAIETLARPPLVAESQILDSVLAQQSHAVGIGPRTQYVSCVRARACDWHGADVIVNVSRMWLRKDSASVIIGIVSPSPSRHDRLWQVRRRLVFVKRGESWLLTQRQGLSES